LQNILTVFRGQRGVVQADLARSRQRYFVCDVTTAGWKPGLLAEEDVLLCPREGLVFRAGRYAVYALDASQMPAWVEKYLDR
jgi:hypothetical protein